MADLWQVTLRNTYSDFIKKLEVYNQAEMAKSRRKMLQVRNTAEEVAEPSSRMLNDDEEGPDESIVKLSACFE